MRKYKFTINFNVKGSTNCYSTVLLVRLIANSETEARLQLPADYRLELDRPIAKIRLNPTACDQTKGGVYA